MEFITSVINLVPTLVTNHPHAEAKPQDLYTGVSDWPSPYFSPRPGEIPLRAFIRPVFNRYGKKTYPGAETPIRTITHVPEPLNGRADEASPRDPPRQGLAENFFPSVLMPFLRSSCPWKKMGGRARRVEGLT